MSDNEHLVHQRAALATDMDDALRSVVTTAENYGRTPRRFERAELNKAMTRLCEVHAQTLVEMHRLLAALDAATADATRERERAEAAEARHKEHNDALNCPICGHPSAAAADLAERFAVVLGIGKAEARAALATTKQRLAATERSLADLRAEVELRAEDASRWCDVSTVDAPIRDAVYDWARTDTRGTTPFRELGADVIASLVGIVARYVATVRAGRDA